MKILCVAEKGSIARSVAESLGGGQVERRQFGSARRNGYPPPQNYSFTCNLRWCGSAQMVMTAVRGHLTEINFPSEYSNWSNVDPMALFHCDIVTKTSSNCEDVVKNIEKESRYADKLFLWTDCDREGEYIAQEIVQVAQRANPRLRGENILRATFNNLERSHIYQAAQNPTRIDERQVNAVAVRQELDLRTGSAFTRFQCLLFQRRFEELKSKLVSFGTCQFPTLGFIVDRYKRVEQFVSEKFWYLSITAQKDGESIQFSWSRNRLFDRLSTLVIYENCLSSNRVLVTNISSKPTSMRKPLPLTTVELQKSGARWLKISSKQIMDIAEDLYSSGFISYPRTETDQFDPDMDLRKLIQPQRQSPAWGTYAGELLDSKFVAPRRGTHNDKAHPPIHPVKFATPASLGNPMKAKVYEFIVRHFLACCSDDARGHSTTISVSWVGEVFSTTELVVLERNFLDVYPYKTWKGSKQLPVFQPNEELQLVSTEMKEGATSPPGYLTEAELIALMDANGIGTDATMAEHIDKVLAREYAMRVDRAGRPTGGGAKSGKPAKKRKVSKNQAGGPGGPTDDSTGSSDFFVPTLLGVALVEGYDAIGMELSLSKPFLRRNLEQELQEICQGRKQKQDVLERLVEMYQTAFALASQRRNLLVSAYQRIKAATATA